MGRPDPTGQDPYQKPYDPQYVQPPLYPGQQYAGYQPYPGYAPAPQGDQQDPDNAMGIVGLVLAIAACAPVGLIISWIALNKSKERGYKNTPALVGAILGGVFTALGVLAVVAYVLFLVLLVGATSSASLL